MGYNIFRRLFRRKKEEEKEQEPAEETEEHEENPSVISLSLSILKSGDLDVNCKWENEDYDSAVMLGEILCYLKNGTLSVYVINILIKYISENPESAEFLNTVFGVAEKLEDSGNNYPLVRPSQVFKDGI
tara:strand:+ start:266 stop:655 length:390 start_codon:yes stop_codon:yes gene_type:complete